MRYLSVCSGIEAASVAWHSLGWTPVGFSEIDPFASAVLAARFGSNLPGEPLSGNAPPNFGDFTAIDLESLGAVDLLVGGTPCQAFSFAGRRLSLEDARGNLTLAYSVLAHELVRSHGLRNALWENVPGVLSTKDNAFGCFIGALVGADSPVPLPAGAKRWPHAGVASGPKARLAWRLLDAQYFGLAQRRKRVFVVVDFGNGADPVSVLFEPKGLRGDTPPSRETGQSTTHDVAPSLVSSGRGVDRAGDTRGQDPVVAVASTSGNGYWREGIGPLRGRAQDSHEMLVAHTLRGSGFDASEDGTGRGTPLIPVVAFTAKDYGGDATNDLSPTLRGGNFTTSHANGGVMPAVAYAIQAGALRENPESGPDGIGVQADHAYTLEARAEVQAVAYDLRGREGGAQFEGPHDTANIRAASGGSSKSYVLSRWRVRRLIPKECARLQGFEDDHARISWRGKPAEECPDGPQYEKYGNSMATNVMAWLGQQIVAATPQPPAEPPSVPSSGEVSMKCACHSDDAHNCWALRYHGHTGVSELTVADEGGPCECECHEVSDDDERRSSHE